MIEISVHRRNRSTAAGISKYGNVANNKCIQKRTILVLLYNENKLVKIRIIELQKFK